MAAAGAHGFPVVLTSFVGREQAVREVAGLLEGYRLAPLTVPSPDVACDDSGAEAVTLFADRARAADAGFALTDQNRRDVARLVGRLDGMPLAIELAAARAEALGVSQLLRLLDGRLGLLAGGDRRAAGRHRSLAATAEWSYQLLAEDERRVFRHLSVFPAPFTLEAAEAVTGREATPVVLRLVDCSLLVPPRPGPDGRSRYAMLETLRGYGAGLLAQAGEQDQAQAALARYAVRVAEEAGAGMLTTAGELAAARRLDAEDAMMEPVLAWAVGHDLDAVARLVTALSMWWMLRGRLDGQEPLLRELAGRAEPGSDGWCTAQHWLASTAFEAADLPQALQRCAAILDVIGDRAPSRALVDGLAMQSTTLSNLGRLPEAAAASRRALAMASELGYPLGQVLATTGLVAGALHDGDPDEAVRLARQSAQIPDIPGTAYRVRGYLLAAVLAEAGDLAAAEQACVVTLAQARDAGDMVFLGDLLRIMAGLDLRAGRTGDAAAHLREAARLSLQTGTWLLTLNVLRGCGHLCAATGRPADAVTVWAAWDTFNQQRELAPGGAAPRRRLAQRPGGARPGPGPRGRTARQGDEHGYRGRIRPDADRPGPAADGGGGRAGQAQPPGTGAGHPGRPGPHRRADRRPVVHQHPHRPLPPGPDPGQDRLPPPRRPDPAGPGRRPGLARPGAWVVLPRPPRRAKRGNQAAARAPAGRENLPVRPEQPARSGQEPIMFAYLSRRGAHPHAAARLRRLIVALAAVTGGALAWAAAVPAASAAIIPVPGDGPYGPGPAAPPGPVPMIAAGGMPGWQITLIAVAAALAAAAAAVVLDRARTSRRAASITG